MSLATFSYLAVDRAGHRKKGTAVAASDVDVLRKLQAAGLVPIKIKKVAVGRRRRVAGKKLAEFTYQFAVLVSARIPMADGLRSIAEQEKPGHFRMVIEALANRIESGDSIGAAMGEHSAVFGETYIATVRAAEQTGNLIKALEYLAEVLERQDETNQQIKGAMTYPLIILVVLLVACAFLIGFVVPRFAKIFASRNVELPILTQVMVFMGNVAQNYWYLVIAGAVASFFIGRMLLSKPSFMALIERGMHQIPFAREILVSLGVARFARVFGLCLSSGINLLDALDLAGRASGRVMLRRDLDVVASQVRAGGRISQVMDGCTYLPAFARRMIASGDEAAELPRMCGVIARQYERESTMRTKRLSTVIEPLLIVVVAAVVMVVALAIFLPMWNSLSLMGT